MITGDQIVAHLLGDYILQSDKMAILKRSSSAVCLYHALWYTVPFVWLYPLRWLALVFILASHFLVDRFGLARYVVWAKNRYLGDGPPWMMCRKTGYPPATPPWMATWLTIIADNTIHILGNAWALKHL